jgi:hypothetical protein
MKEISMSPIESWVKAYTLENYFKEENIELLGKKQYELFNEWCKKCNIDYKVTIQAFGMRLKRLKIAGIEKGRHTALGDTNIFEIKILRQYFHLDNELIVEPPEETTDNELDEK